MKRLNRFLALGGAIALPILLTVVLSGCGGPKAGSSGAGGTAGATGKPLTVGFLYVGPKTDYGYNQAHAAGAAAVKKLPGVKVFEEENVPESEQVQKSMKSMIEQEGATLLFPTSYGYFKPHVIAVAKDYPKVTFLHCGGNYDEKECTPNISTYFGNTYEVEYLCGIIAGAATKTKKIGFIAAKPIPQVRANINGFLLGARSVDPTITCKVIFTDDWSNQVKEVEAAKSLMADGVDVITCHVDSPKAIMQEAEKGGIMCCGYHASQADLAPKGYLTGTEWNWEHVYPEFVKKIQKGEKVDHMIRGGLKEQFVKMSPYGPLAPADAKKKADDLKEQMVKGTFEIFKGPIKDNKGGMAVPDGKTFTAGTPEIEGMNFFVDGVIAP
jgi:simple sugar transport system substrate-binding protein